MRQAAAIHFKNLCSREWDPEEEEAGAAPRPRLPEADKAVVRANMLEALVQSPPIIRAQLGVALRSQLEADFPERWPELLPGILGALGSTEKERLHGGLFALRFLCRKYEYKNEAARAMLHGVVAQVAPALLQLTQGLLALGSLQLEVAELLKLVLKTLWSCLCMDIPPTLQPAEAFHPRMLVLGALVELPLPIEAQPADRDDREAWAWWKAKKWAFRICNRLFSRYSVPKQSRDPAHRAFAERFKTTYSCQVLGAYIRVLSALPAGGYLPDRVVNYALQLLEHGAPPPHPGARPPAHPPLPQPCPRWPPTACCSRSCPTWCSGSPSRCCASRRRMRSCGRRTPTSTSARATTSSRTCTAPAPPP